MVPWFAWPASPHAAAAATPYSAVMRLLPALSPVNQPVRYRTYTQTLCAVIKQANTTRGEVDRPFNTCLAGEGSCAIRTSWCSGNWRTSGRSQFTRTTHSYGRSNLVGQKTLSFNIYVHEMVKVTILKALPPTNHNAERTEAVRILETLLLFES